jgi:phosphate transport system permease protein
MDAHEYGEKTGLKNMSNFSNINSAIFAKRKRANKIGLVLSTAAMVLPLLDQKAVVYLTRFSEAS